VKWVIIGLGLAAAAILLFSVQLLFKLRRDEKKTKGKK
jgi:hypothetical protein